MKIITIVIKIYATKTSQYRSLRKHDDRERQKNFSRGLGGLRSRGNEWGRRDRFSRLEDEVVHSWCLKIEIGRGVANDIGATVLNVNMYFRVARVVLGSGLPASDDRVESKRDHLQKNLNLNKVENQQFKEVHIEEDCCSEGHVLTYWRYDKKLATIEAEKRTLSKSNAKLLASTGRKKTKSTSTRDIFVGNISQMYLVFAYHADKIVLLCCCETFTSISNLDLSHGKGCRWRTENIRVLGAQREGQLLFASDNPFLFCSSHTQYTSSTSCAAQGLQKILGNRSAGKQCTSPFPTQRRNTFTVLIPKLNKALKGRVNQTLEELDSARKWQAQIKLFKYLGWYCLLSRQIFSLEEAVRRKAQQSD